MRRSAPAALGSDALPVKILGQRRQRRDLIGWKLFTMLLERFCRRSSRRHIFSHQCSSQEFPATSVLVLWARGHTEPRVSADRPAAQRRWPLRESFCRPVSSPLCLPRAGAECLQGPCEDGREKHMYVQGRGRASSPKHFAVSWPPSRGLEMSRGVPGGLAHPGSGGGLTLML